MDQQMDISKNALVITSVVLVAIGIIILLAVLFSGRGCNCGGDGDNESFDRPPPPEVNIEKEKINTLAKNQSLASVEDPNSHGGFNTEMSGVEDINRHQSLTDTSVTNRSEDTVGQTATTDITDVESVKKRPRHSDLTSSDFSSPTDKTH